MATPGSTPTVIDERFLLLAVHRRGGMGAIWRARDLRADRVVALKLLHATARDQAERFVREARLLADLPDAGVVKYLAHGVTGEGASYLAMEWLDGENVAERLARAPLTLRESLALARAALRGLAAAHERGIVHRDLKPSNLFLRDGRVDDAVLLDLGIARAGRDDAALTRTGAILGTPSYMAPEQAQGQSGVTAAVDVYSLGCVLFECLTGDPPFVGEHVFGILTKVLFEEAPRVSDLRPEVPAAVDALLARMLAKDPADRFPDAAALIPALDELGGVADVDPPARTRAAPRATPLEQELVSVILMTCDEGAGGAPTFPDVAAYAGQLKQLADGTTVITLAQRGGAATDLAARAARCALRAREVGASWNIVLATGRGVARDRMHIGEAADRAATLQRARGGRAPGAICLDEVTAGLLDARFQTARGDGGLVLLESEQPSIDPARPLLGRPTACVGRDQELGMLELALRATIDEPAARALLVTGQAGMGKSRLRHELVRRLAGDDILVVTGLGDPIRTSSASSLLGGALARLCGVRPDATDAENRAAFEARIGRHLVRDEQRTHVFLGELCRLSYPSETLPELGAARQNPRIMGDLVTRAWLAFLEAESAERPVLLILDDLQWSDALTVQLVDAALKELAAAPVMVLALARPEVLELFPELWAPRLAAVLPLRPLAAGVTARFVKQVLGDEVGDATLQRIVSRSEGNALYLEELIRAAHD